MENQFSEFWSIFFYGEHFLVGKKIFILQVNNWSKNAQFF